MILHSRPALSHDQASLIARLALHSVWPAADLETIRELLPQFSPGRILAALDQALEELAAEGQGPDFPAGRDADAYLMLHEGLRKLARLSKSIPVTLLAAA